MSLLRKDASYMLVSGLFTAISVVAAVVWRIENYLWFDQSGGEARAGMPQGPSWRPEPLNAWCVR